MQQNVKMFKKNTDTSNRLHLLTSGLFNICVLNISETKLQHWTLNAELTELQLIN